MLWVKRYDHFLVSWLSKSWYISKASNAIIKKWHIHLNNKYTYMDIDHRYRTTHVHTWKLTTDTEEYRQDLFSHNCHTTLSFYHVHFWLKVLCNELFQVLLERCMGQIFCLSEQLSPHLWHEHHFCVKHFFIWF